MLKRKLPYFLLLGKNKIIPILFYRNVQAYIFVDMTGLASERENMQKFKRRGEQLFINLKPYFTVIIQIKSKETNVNIYEPK